MRIVIIIYVLIQIIVCNPAYCQDISGEWSGVLVQSDVKYFSLDLTIIQQGDRLSGLAAHESLDNTIKGRGIFKFKGFIKGNKVTFEHTEVVEAVTDGYWCLPAFEGILRFDKIKNEYIIRGEWVSNKYYDGKIIIDGCYPGRFTIFKSKSIKVPNPKSFSETAVKPTMPKYPLSEAKVIEVKKTESFILKNVLFKISTPILLPKSVSELDTLQKRMITNSKLKIRLEGHTDKIGDSNKNLVLSGERAIAVKNYLIQKGIDASRITTIGYGDTKPLCNTPCKENMRVEFVITNQ
jgi:outer membrane protein OmpA-like peptidoglycan-associated protein